ncbi:MAG: nuclear transport factor 2 family protein [Actinomycetota bacterium]
MAAERQELILDLFERWNHGDREIDAAAVDPDAEVHSAMTRAVYRGYGGIKDWMAEIDEQFESWQISVDELRDVPDGSLVVLGRVHFRGRASGVEFDQSIAWLIWFAGERISTMCIFSGHDRALEAAGLA